jgi:hypothetical protein
MYQHVRLAWRYGTELRDSTLNDKGETKTQGPWFESRHSSHLLPRCTAAECPCSRRSQAGQSKEFEVSHFCHLEQSCGH